MADGAGFDAGGARVVEDPKPLVRFVPDRIYMRDGRQMLRGALAFIPDPNYPDALSVWPDWVSGELNKGVRLFLSDISNATAPAWTGQADPLPLSATPLHETDTGPATRLWQALFAPILPDAPSAGVQLAYSASHHSTQTLLGHLQTISTQPWIALAQSIADGQSGQRERPLAITPPAGATPNGALRIVATPAQEVDGVLSMFRAVRHLASLPIRARGLASLGPATEHWSTVSGLFSGRLAAAPAEPLVAAGAGDDAALYAVGRRGKLAGVQAAADHDRCQRASRTAGQGAGQIPFDRFPPNPQPELRLTTTLHDTIVKVRGDDLAAAQAAFDNYAPTQGVTPPPGRRDLAHEQLAAWFSSSAASLMGPSPMGFGAPQGVALQQAFVRHMLSLRPDPTVTYAGTAYWPDNSPADPAELHKVLTDFSDTMNRRLFGVQAYPALARAVKLVVDVEVAIPDSAIARIGAAGSTAWFLLGAAIGATNTPVAWTACKRRDTLFMPATAQEVAAFLTGPPSTDYSTYEGVWNLAARAGNSPRFTLTSVDVVGGAEQFVQDALSSANDRRTGAALIDSGQPPERGVGLAIVDGLRAEAAQAQNADGQTQATALKGQKPVVFYTDQLTLGYRLDVAVEPRQAGPRRWRALGRRKVRFGAMRDLQGRFAVEPIVEAALKASAPVVNGKVDWKRFRADLDEVSHKPAARVVVEHAIKAGDPAEAAQAVAQQTIAQWDGSPMGAATARAKASAKIKAEVDILQDLPISVTFSLPTAQDEPERPPQLEIGRAYRFGMRHAYLGGGGHTTGSAEAIYSGAAGPLFLPQSDADAIFRRPERVGAPVLARLHGHGPAPGSLPGDNVGDVIVRSGDLPECETRLARRIVYAPGLPMAFAIQHPASNNKARILDGAPTLGKRPIGGFINVALDPDTGGLPVLRNGEVAPARPVDIAQEKPVIALNEPPAEGTFQVEGTDRDDLTERKAHYYPDPAIDRIIFELWTRGPNARPIDGAHVEVEIYSKDYRQAADREIFGTDDGVACTYPHAMPVVVEVQRGTVRQLLHEPARDTGTISDRGDFKVLQPGWAPEDDTVTARRVRVVLPPGEDVDVRAWAWSAPEKLEWFRTFDGVTKILSLLSGPPVHGLETQQLGATIAKVFGATLRAADVASMSTVRKLVTNVMAELHATTPTPDQSEILTFRAVHAAQRPAAPLWLCGPSDTPFKQCPAASPPAGEDPGQFRLFVLRQTVADRDWPQWLANNPTPPQQWDGLHQLGAATTWLGGELAFDLKRANKLTFRTLYRDVRDTPGKPIPLQDGAPHFPMKGPTLTSVPLDDDPYALGAPEAFEGRQLDVLRSLGGKPRGLVLHLPDARAYRLEITPTASSRFVRMLRANANASNEEEYFTTSGATQTLWVPATVRPAPMAHVDLLPVFVWDEEQDGGARIKTRTTRMRIAWKRPGVSSPNTVRNKISTGSWYSSGEGERLGLVFLPKGQAIGPASSLGPVEPYISRWGADPIRTARDKPGWALPDTFLRDNPGMTAAPDQQMPFPGDPDDPDTAPKLMQKVDLQTFAPLYDEQQDTWYVDIAIDPGQAASPWIQLGLVRYQEHALKQGARDLRVSLPTSVGFRLEPFRKISVKPLPRRLDDKLWPVEISVSGPLSFVNGGASVQPSQALRDELARISRPRFRLRILREPFLSSLTDAGEVIVGEATSDDAPPPSGEELWRTTVYLEHSPTASPHHVFIEEVDPMMSANPDSAHPETLVESGPRFMAKVRIHRPH